MTAVAIHLSYSTPKRVLAYVGMRFLNGIWQSGGKRQGTIRGRYEKQIIYHFRVHYMMMRRTVISNASEAFKRNQRTSRSLLIPHH